MLGGETGVRGYFESPDGVRFQVVVMEMAEGYDATAKARRWACVGWDVTLAYEGFAFAAGTGTDQSNGTYTPEQPPHMTRSPVPGTTEQARTLLSYSPMLSAEVIGSNEQDCADG